MGSERLLSAILLTVGEKTTQAAYDSLRSQTIPLVSIIVIKNISPFSIAFNQGVSQITTPFFIQCDADMILDKNCAEVLLSKVRPDTGMVWGHLRDPLQGRIGSIKLFNTEYCRLYPQVDSFNCENIFVQELLKRRITVEKIEASDATLGRHEPDITDPVYNFERFKYMGGKISARKDWYDFAYRLIWLVKHQDRQTALHAALALICGFYVACNEDHLKIYVASEEYCWLKRLLPVFREGSGGVSHPSFGGHYFLTGYWDGVWIKSGWKRSTVMKAFNDCAYSYQYSQWAYLLGLFTAIMSPEKTWADNIVTRSIKIFPFLKYLRSKFKYHLQVYETEKFL